MPTARALRAPAWSPSSRCSLYNCMRICMDMYIRAWICVCVCPCLKPEPYARRLVPQLHVVSAQLFVYVCVYLCLHYMHAYIHTYAYTYMHTCLTAMNHRIAARGSLSWRDIHSYTHIHIHAYMPYHQQTINCSSRERHTYIHIHIHAYMSYRHRTINSSSRIAVVERYTYIHAYTYTCIHICLTAIWPSIAARGSLSWRETGESDRFVALSSSDSWEARVCMYVCVYVI